METNAKSHRPILPSHFAVFFSSVHSTPQHALLSEIERVCMYVPVRCNTVCLLYAR